MGKLGAGLRYSLQGSVMTQIMWKLRPRGGFKDRRVEEAVGNAVGMLRDSGLEEPDKVLLPLLEAISEAGGVD